MIIRKQVTSVSLYNYDSVDTYIAAIEKAKRLVLNAGYDTVEMKAQYPSVELWGIRAETPDEEHRRIAHETHVAYQKDQKRIRDEMKDAIEDAMGWSAAQIDQVISEMNKIKETKQ